jgi:hypothetical protein
VGRHLPRGHAWQRGQGRGRRPKSSISMNKNKHVINKDSTPFFVSFIGSNLGDECFFWENDHNKSFLFSDSSRKAYKLFYSLLSLDGFRWFIFVFKVQNKFYKLSLMTNFRNDFLKIAVNVISMQCFVLRFSTMPQQPLQLRLCER